jgi:hypothetical protein
MFSFLHPSFMILLTILLIFLYLFSLSDLQERKKDGEENWNKMQQQLQAKAQDLRYEDELARKRMQVLTSLPFPPPPSTYH